MTDYKLQRTNMVESQVRPSDVTDRRIIRAMQQVPREQFVPASLRGTAYMDADLTIVQADGRQAARAMMSPRVFAKLVQLANIASTDIVLDVGCLTGYSAAVLSRLAQTVVALETDDALVKQAATAIAELSIDNAVTEAGELSAGAAAHGPYDVIVLGGAVPDVPRGLLDQLKDGGRLAAVVAEGRFGKACLWTRIGDSFDMRADFDAGASPLPGFERAAAFQL